MAAEHEAGEWLARVQVLVEAYQAAQKRQLLERALKLWRSAQLNRLFATLDAPPDLVH